jgi:DNA invertase Pin-like site-specific DNA recombinase
MLTVLAGAAELEKNLIGERTSSAMQSMKAQGLYTGGRVRYGYAVAADGVTLTECPTEQATIAEARALSARGLSQRAIAAELAERGMLTRNGRMFDQKAIPTLLAA